MPKLFILVCFVFSSFILRSQNFVSTYAGNGTPGFINGDTAMARFKTPFGICMDKNGNLYIADGGNNCIRKISSTGTVTTLAGSGTTGFADGPAASAQFNSPTGVCVDDSGNVYVADFQNHRIRKISVGGMVTTVAGNGTAGYVDGAALSSEFNYPRGICINKNGIIFVGDSWNHRIRKVVQGGNVSTYAGGGINIGVGSTGGLVNANDTAARFYTPCGLTIDKTGNVYVADAYNHRIRKIDTTRQVTTVAGSGPTGLGNGGYANGPVSTALLNTPTELNVDSTGSKLYIGDTFNNRVRYLSGGSVSLIAGRTLAGYTNGIDTVAQFNYPRGVVANKQGSLIFVVDYNNHAVRKISTSITLTISESSSQNKNLNIFPNPGSGIFSIKGIEKNFTICDVNGKEVYRTQTTASSTLDLGFLDAGIYFVKDDSHGMMKLVIVK